MVFTYSYLALRTPVHIAETCLLYIHISIWGSSLPCSPLKSMHTEPQKNAEKKGQLPKKMFSSTSCSRVCVTGSHSCFIVWAHLTDRLVAPTTSYNQLFYHHWNSIHARINQTTGCISVRWLPSLYLMTACFPMQEREKRESLSLDLTLMLI